MPDREGENSVAIKWYAVAMEDIRVTRACLALDPPSLGNAAYHCQQAAEKIVKGLLIQAQAPFRRVHDLDELVSIAAPLYPALSATLDCCRPLTTWATDYRYPSDDELPPPTVEDIREALEVLQTLLKLN